VFTNWADGAAGIAVTVIGCGEFITPVTRDGTYMFEGEFVAHLEHLASVLDARHFVVESGYER
jgi:hypothetical protein